MAIGKQLSDGNPDGVSLGQSASDLISLYGVTPASQRASSLQADSIISVSSNITIAASLTAWIREVSATLKAVGAWKGGA